MFTRPKEIIDLPQCGSAEAIKIVFVMQLKVLGTRGNFNKLKDCLCVLTEAN
jgi:hypothetical protein